MTEIAHLIVRVSSQGTQQVPNELSRVAGSADKAERKTYSLTKAWIAATVALAGFYVGLRKTIEVGTKFESLTAQLDTATGSVENAALAFESLQDFAASTPYALEQSVTAFIRLKNLGLDPSEKALRSYGNTASAMGKDLIQLVEAVADATTGEFERLKEFGVKARTEADGISFTFQGTTTKVENSAKAIEGFLITLGESKFGNAMEKRMATLEGKISNLGDAWDSLFNSISEAGVGDLVKDAIDQTIVAIAELERMIKSGQLPAYIKAFATSFLDALEEIRSGLMFTGNFFRSELSSWGTDGANTAKFIADSFSVLPKTITASVELFGAQLGAMSAKAEAFFKTTASLGSRAAKNAVEGPGAILKTIENFLVDGPFEQPAKPVSDLIDQFLGGSKSDLEQYEKSIQAAAKAYEDLSTEIGAEHNAAVSAFKEQIALAGTLRAKFDDIEQAKKTFLELTKLTQGGLLGMLHGSSSADPLAQFKNQTQGASFQFLKLVDDLKSQEQVLKESYDKRVKLIIDNTAAESDARASSLEMLDRQFADERSKMIDRNRYEFDERVLTVQGQSKIEEETRKTAFEQELQALDRQYAAKLIKEEEYYSRKESIERGHAKITADIVKQTALTTQRDQLQNYQTVLGFAGDLSNQIADIAQEGTTASKIAFGAAKAIAIAQAIVYTELAAVRALVEGGSIAGIPLSGAIRALGYSSVALMAATSFAEISKHEHGSMISSGRLGLVGENGPELVQGPAFVNSARTTAGMMGRGGDMKVYVNVIDQRTAESSPVEIREHQTDRGREINVILKDFDRRTAADIRRGGNQTARAFEETYGLRRRVA